MKIIDLLDDRSILLDGRVADKKAALDQMVELMDASGKLRDKETYRQGVYAREQEGSTGIGEGIAIPHCKSDAVIKPGLAAMVVKDGVEFESLDGQPAHLFFLIAAPNTEDNVHLDVLSRLSVLLMDEDFTNKLRQAASVSEFKQIIEEAEKGSENEDDTAVERMNSEHYIVAVTGCPTGIAHTYMAAESLEKKAKELGYSIKVETRGAVLAKYVFANESLGGFSKFISNFAFVGENGGNTVSGFLGGIAAGFVAGFIVLGLKKLCSKLPDSLEGIKPTLIYPLVGIFLIGILMTMVFNPLIGLINTGLSNMLTSISDAGMITVLGLILGAMMAIDMGGPINKAAYVFGSGMLATASQMMAQGAQASDPAVQACYMAMASIMVGGMVPPVGIAAACKLFPRKFTKAEQGSAVSNIVMGCSFITEGAIPFAASDPLHVIPCTMGGAGVARIVIRPLWMYLNGSAWWCVCICYRWTAVIIYCCMAGWLRCDGSDVRIY